VAFATQINPLARELHFDITLYIYFTLIYGINNTGFLKLGICATGG
jgi:hypothetical protein